MSPEETAFNVQGRLPWCYAAWVLAFAG